MILIIFFLNTQDNTHLIIQNNPERKKHFYINICVRDKTLQSIHEILQMNTLTREKLGQICQK
jgi:hypothetical protein